MSGTWLADGRGRRALVAGSLTVLLTAALLLAVVATPVAAHAYLSDSDPGNGEQLESVPDEVTLYFSGDGVQNAEITVTGPDGDVVGDEPVIDPDDTQIVRVPLEGAPDGDDSAGMYTVEWEVLADDGHTTSGTFFFSVGDEPLDRDAVLETYEDDETDESPPPLETVAKGLALVALVGLVGGPVTAAVAVYPVTERFGTATRSVDRRLARLFAGASVLLVAAVVAHGVAQMPTDSVGALSTDTVLEFVGMPLGQAWLVQVALAGSLVALSLAPVAGAVSRRSWLAGTVVGAVGVGAAVSWTSHSATAVGRLQGTLVDFGHVVGAGLWVGGLLVLALVVPSVLRDVAATDRAALAAGTVRRYSLLALAGVTLAAASGLVLAAWHVPDLAALGGTVYGTALSAKTLLVLLALGFGGFTRFALLRRLEPARDVDPGSAASADGGEPRAREDGDTVATFRRAVRLELALLVVVLLLSGLLTSIPTAAVAGGDGLGTTTIEREGTVDLELTVTPADHDEDGDDDTLVARAGDPVVFEALFLEDGDPVETDREPRLSADGPDGSFDVDLERADDGSYVVVQPLPEAGEWELELSYERDGQFLTESVAVTALEDVETHDHDHDEHSEHDDHDGHGNDDRSAFTTLLEFGAVAVAVVGSIAVALEAVRFPRFDD